MVFAVELSRAGKQNGSCRHVESHGEGFGGEQSLDKPFPEKNLDRFLEDRQQSRVMDSDTTFEKRKDIENLRAKV